MPAHFASLRYAPTTSAAASASLAALFVYDSDKDKSVIFQHDDALSWDECQTIRSLPVRPEQPDRFLCDWNSGWGKGTSDQVIEGMVSCWPTRSPFADETPVYVAHGRP